MASPSELGSWMPVWSVVVGGDSSLVDLSRALLPCPCACVLVPAHAHVAAADVRCRHFLVRGDASPHGDRHCLRELPVARYTYLPFFSSPCPCSAMTLDVLAP
jgi:hypothetical protein